MKIAIAQINCTVGDLAGNTAKILAAAEQAKLAGADLVITPELALCGYPPQDLLLRTEFYLACNRALTDLVSQVKDITLLVGHPHHEAVIYTMRHHWYVMVKSSPPTINKPCSPPSSLMNPIILMQALNPLHLY